jgi:hypothetical protein
LIPCLNDDPHGAAALNTLCARAPVML